MRLVRWTDDRGYDHLSLVRDTDPDEYAQYGVPLGIPDLNELDWQEIKRDLHNELVSRHLTSWQAVQESQGGLTSAIMSAMRRRLALLYRQEYMEESDAV